MALTLTEALDNLYTTTWSHMKSEAIDNIFDSTPFWAWMKSNGRLKSVIGGRQILESVEYAKNDGVGFIGKGGTVSLNDREFLTQAVYDWHYLVAPLVRFGTDDQKNRGKTQIMSLMNSKLANAKNSLIDQLEISLCANVSASLTGAFDGLQVLVKTTDGQGTVGGIDSSQATYSWWRNQFTVSSAGTMNLAIGDMRTMYNKCMNNRTQDAPDIILTDQTRYELYEGVALPTTSVNGVLRVSNTKMLDLGFDSIAFKNIPIIWSPQCLAQCMYFLNTRYLNFVYDPGMNFDMTEWKPIPEQVNDRAAQIVTACTMTTNRRRVHGVISNLPAV